MPEHAGQLERATLLHPLGGWRAADQRRRINEESLVIRIDHGSHSFLFTGDIEHEAESVCTWQRRATKVLTGGDEPWPSRF